MAPSALPPIPRSLADDLRTRTAGQITRLLTLRPDLMHPWPADLGQLARRAADDASVLEAMQSLNTRELRVLEVVAGMHEATVDEVRKALPGDAGIDEAVAVLWARALLWGGPDVFRIARAAQQAFGPYPCGLAPATSVKCDAATVRAMAAEVDPQTLNRWVWHNPVSTSPHPLLTVRGEHFELPRAAALLLRDGVFLPPVPDAPDPARAESAPGLGLWAPLAGVRYVLTELTREPLPRNPVRGVSRRTLAERASAMAVPEPDLAAWLELAAQAGLIGPVGESCRPTAEAHVWLRSPAPQMWSALVAAWLDSDRPLPACRPDDLGCLTTTVRPRTAHHRANILEVWPAAARVGAAELRGIVAWQRPRMHEAADQVEEIVAEAVLLGLVEAGAATQALERLPADVAGAAALVEAPDPGGLVIQPDHTVMAPLSIDVATWQLLQGIARVESWGPVTMHRIDPARLRVYVAGRRVDDVLAELSRACRTPVPQSVDYAVRDAARTSPVRVYPATVIEAGPEEREPLRLLGLAEAGGRIFTSELPPEVVVSQLEAAGFATSTGELPKAGDPLDYPRTVAGHDDVAVRRLVEHLLGDHARNDTSPPPLLAADPQTMVSVCLEAISNHQRLWLEYADVDGTRTALVEPIEMRSGRLTGWSLTTARTVTVPLSRIAAYGGDDA